MSDEHDPEYSDLTQEQIDALGVELRKEIGAFRDEYYKSHRRCPRCGSLDHNSTYVGYIVVVGEEDKFRDENDIQCKQCGWQGICHEMVA